MANISFNVTASYTYNINGNVVKTVDPMLREYISTYDANGNLTSQSDAKGQFSYIHYNAANQKTQSEDTSGSEILDHVMMPPVYVSRTGVEQCDFIRKALKDEISEEGLLILEREGMYGTLSESFLTRRKAGQNYLGLILMIAWHLG